MAGGELTLRTATAGDRQFLFSVYAASRAEEMAQLVDWDEAQREQFLRFQFEAQDRHYREHYPDARFDVVQLDGDAIGRLYLDWRAGELRIMDIALLPEWRGRRIGRRLMEDALAAATERGAFVSLHVERDNPARQLYQRLGFRDIEEVSFYMLMHWHPEHGAAPGVR